jgi:small-conductance mechanosensitive channel
VTIPNNKITTSVVRNFSLPSPQVRIQIPVNVAAGTDIGRAKTVLMALAGEAIRSRSDIIVSDPAPTVYLIKMDKSTLTFELTVFTSEFRYTSIIRDLLNTRIIEEFKREGIAMA